MSRRVALFLQNPLLTLLFGVIEFPWLHLLRVHLQYVITDVDSHFRRN